MSAMPQIPKLMISTPITTAMMVLPSQFDEALRIPRSMGPTCLQEGTGSRRGRFKSACQGVAELMLHHKVAARRSQPRPGGELAGKGAERSGTGADALLALGASIYGNVP